LVAHDRMGHVEFDVAEAAALWAAYKVQLLSGLAVVVLAWGLVRTMVRLLTFLLVLAFSAAVGIGAAYGLTRVGVPEQAAYWGAVGITFVVLLLGTWRDEKR
jgi:hypothetical protein